MDEAHSALDLAQQSVLNGYMKKLRDAGVAIIVVTHSLEFARRHADQIVVIENHTLAEIGPVEILDNPRSNYLRAALQDSA
jgi:ABC-type glutathione transport system ATPase component